MDTLIESIASGNGVLESAKVAGFTLATCRKLMTTDRFKSGLEVVRKERRARLVDRLAAMGQTALKVHMEVMNDPKHRDRLEAAQSTLDRQGVARRQVIEQTGTVTTVNTDLGMSDFDGRTPEALLHYAQHGVWPDDEPQKQ